MLVKLNRFLPTQFNRWLARAYVHASRLRWGFVLGLCVGHMALSYGSLWWAAEAALLSPTVFWYFYVTTATTVGYGDFSPSSTIGQFVVTLFVMPGGIVLFTTILAKLIQDVTNAWRKRMNGLQDYSQLAGHIVLVGWCGPRTSRMVELIRGDESDARDILLLANIAENPLPNQLMFVQADNLASPASIQQAGVPQADLVIVLCQDDHESLTAALAVGAVYQQHLVVYFEQASFAALLQQHCPNAEAVVSLSVENTVRTAQDPGSSQVVSQLLSNLEGQTQYRIQVPVDQATVTYGELFWLFKQQYDATLLGLRDDAGQIRLNPTSATLVPGGTALFIMAAKRLLSDQIAWP